ncbi:hypothetical protein [Sphingobium sp. LF-16]|uniref:hypothetical protein n=1 Tax=Sphingobium sp. LF-16 TaxID=2185111 RepID=UPI0013DDCDFB|nr:hypothetical protein [Sphingobium sp. LF-16]
MAKSGKRERHQDACEQLPDVDVFLFSKGISASDYFITDSGSIGFRDKNGREFDLIIDHPRLAIAALNTLKALGVGSIV